LKRTINEGNHRVWKQPSDPEGLWERALKDPSKLADYVVAFDGDPVAQAVAGHELQAVTIIAVNGQRKATIFRSRRIPESARTEREELGRPGAWTTGAF
jgi:hypothetical protein